MKELIDQLEETHSLSKDEWITLLEQPFESVAEYAFEKARKLRNKYYQQDIFIRGLIEFSNFCKNDCYYCGIRRSNQEVLRYRLTLKQILKSCETGYHLGFRTFVLQGGEDPYYSDERICEMVSSIRGQFSDCAITLSLGEKPYESYLAYFHAGADRYLLRHETANKEHYENLHPASMSFENRMRCLWDLKRIGYETGTGFMVGSPGQTSTCLAEDMLFIEKLQPQMIGIGPYLPHHETPFAHCKKGSLELTLLMIAYLRLMLPYALIPSTTALGTIDEQGRERGILAGANVVMPNLSPVEVRSNYQLYDDKICTGDEAAECRFCMERRMNSIGYQVVVSRGDCKIACAD
ncbi:MAG TPA: [FeFe] hydrogenase H-cluster radical SAM maturase HydE [Caldisericia bacterium]|mgnify:CR=1 FL=1|nr:[FeFe] hydrogenase H-cluster radical SAM maturase HydE [Caldisericia bacterium]